VLFSTNTVKHKPLEGFLLDYSVMNTYGSSLNRAAKPYLIENFLSIENYVGIFIFVAINLFCGRISGLVF